MRLDGVVRDTLLQEVERTIQSLTKTKLIKPSCGLGEVTSSDDGFHPFDPPPSRGVPHPLPKALHILHSRDELILKVSGSCCGSDVVIHTL